MKKKRSKPLCFPCESLWRIFLSKLKLLPVLMFSLMTLFSVTIYAIDSEQVQQREISGSVSDNEGLSLPGVTVIVKGTTIGTVTDMDGRFSLRVPENAETLQFSFVGMRTQEIALAGRNTFSITMQEESIGIEEVVAVGYGVQKKESVVGSIVQATDEELKRTGNVTDLTQAIAGQLPGVVSLTSSGEPGGVLTGDSGTNLFIRGQNTWNGGQPLVLVDGVERNMNNIDEPSLKRFQTKTGIYL